MNLVAKAITSAEEIKDALSSGRRLVSHFKHSSLACEKLEEEQRKEGLPTHKLLQDVSTRWNSSFYMAQRLLEQRTAVELYSLHHQRDINLSDSEWSVLAMLVRLLEPIEQATKDMCCDDSPLSVQFPIYKLLSAQLNEIDAPLQYKELLILHLSKRFSQLEHKKFVHYPLTEQLLNDL